MYSHTYFAALKLLHKSKEKAMKQNFFALIMSVSCIALLCSCDGGNSEISEKGSSVDGTVGGDTDSDTPIFADFVGEYPENPVSFLTLSKDEIRQQINAQPNLKCSENLYINIPESASVYKFSTYGVHVPQFDYPAERYRKDFEALFKYLFPDREINVDHLKYSKYMGYDYEKGDYITDEGYVKDKEALPDGVGFIYNEMPERTENWSYPVYIELANEIGCGSGIVNKGESAYLAGKTVYDDMEDKWVSSDTFNTLYEFEPRFFFESVGKYSPQSEKSFPLLDGEMKICDAVDFFENYINNAPISTGLQRNMRTRVYNVEVLRVNDTYGYYFTTQPQFQGVNFEPVVYGSMSSYGYNPMGGEAFMIRCGDVDYIHCFYGNAWTFNVELCADIVSIETAIKNISDKLTDAVTFDVNSIEFVYVQQFDKDEQGHINVNTYEADITSAWRITAGNLNDSRTYICYVDAIDGGNFRYYTTPGILNYD